MPPSTEIERLLEQQRKLWEGVASSRYEEGLREGRAQVEARLTIPCDFSFSGEAINGVVDALRSSDVRKSIPVDGQNEILAVCESWEKFMGTPAYRDLETNLRNLAAQQIRGGLFGGAKNEAAIAAAQLAVCILQLPQTAMNAARRARAGRAAYKESVTNG